MSVTLNSRLLAASGGVSPVSLLDIEDVNGKYLYLSDRKIYAPPAMASSVTNYVSESGAVLYRPWLLGVPKFSFHRSLSTDMGEFILQNLSGNSLERDVEAWFCASTIQGAFFIYRYWQPDAEAAWLEVHGTLALDPGADVLSAQIKSRQLLDAAQADTPMDTFCETCQLEWGGTRCGSTQTSECSYSYQSCQVVEHIMVTMNDFEKNYGATTTNVSTSVINRSRRV